MKFLIKFVLALSLFFGSLTGASPLQENLSFALELKGDLTGLFEFEGTWGVQAESVNESAVTTQEKFCSVIELTVRKVTVASVVKAELWPVLNCTIQGQKKQFKLHKIYFKADDSVQTKKIRSLAPNVQNLDLEFRDFSIQKSK